ncbi:hypothetical protein AB1K84_24370 [Mesobacillus foraminis]|uniref:hypothetical protein n=1 Tax=Mesobacillus foraminis TaxID=279826 RepID=UPI0039A152EC
MSIKPLLIRVGDALTRLLHGIGGQVRPRRRACDKEAQRQPAESEAPGTEINTPFVLHPKKTAEKQLIGVEGAQTPAGSAWTGETPQELATRRLSASPRKAKRLERKSTAPCILQPKKTVEKQLIGVKVRRLLRDQLDG